MSTLIRTLAILLLAATSAVAGTGFTGVASSKATYTLNDKVGSNNLTFDSDAPVEKIHGTANGVTGSFILNPADLEATTGTITVPVRNMKTAITKRDDHMYSPNWLDADAFPTISYSVKSLKNVKTTNKDGRMVATATAVGTFTCHGVTKPLEAKVMITFVPESADTKKRASGNLVMVNAQFMVALADYGITGMGNIVGTKVGKEIAIDASLFANS